MSSKGIALALFALALALAACYETPASGDEASGDPACQLQSPAEKEPGYPYDLTAFESTVMPALAGSCGTAGCHAPPTSAGGFTVWAAARVGDCDYARTFNSLASFVDLAKPKNSAVYVAITALPAHPIKLAAGDPVHDGLLGYLEAASARYIADGGGSVTPPPGASPFDYAVFQTQIQPALDTADGRGCAAVGCHGSGAGGFTLVPTPAPDSPEMEANFAAVSGRTNLDRPDTSLVYVQATSRHAAGNSAVVSAEQAAALLAWITTAKANAGEGGGNACVDPARFNLAVFRDEVLPILRGDVDLNDLGQPGLATGCTRGPCHGVDRPPGALVLRNDFTPETSLANFSCFVDLASPSSSDVLLCPLGDPGCSKGAHPGGAVLTGADDLNYQRVLSYLFAARSDAAPLDFAFFARRINPVFDDQAISDPLSGSRSCSDAVACHGVAVAGQLAANGSNFPILPDASDRGRLLVNFTAAASFVNFLNPTESSLFLYPTNEIANLADHALATGLPHPGGEAFAPDSQTALDVLTWAQGLRPDRDGFQRNWLVAGDYPIAAITDPTPVSETQVVPSIFEPSAGRLFGGEWDGVFSDEEDVDLAAALPGGVGNGRAAYAVAYLLNTTSNSLPIRGVLTTPNATQVYVDGVAIAENQGGTSTFLATVPSFRVEKKMTRVLIKILERPGDGAFEFSTQLTDALGTPLSDLGGEIIVKLDPTGGI